MDPKLQPFISAQQIDALNQTLAQQINEDYRDLLKTGGELILAVTLKGALLFAADLVRYLTVPLKIDFIRVASYGSGTKSSGNVMMTKDLESPLVGNHILILDEIVDSGHTIDFLLKKFKDAGAASIRVCSLLNKPSRREADIKVDYVGQDVEDKFLVGYGLDFDEKYRNLKDIFFIET